VSDQFRISLPLAATVVVATVCIYLAFIVLVRFVGPRSLTSMSSFDFGCVVAFGAVLGRTALLTDPTLMIGIVALATFFAMQRLFGLVRRHPALDRLMNRSPVFLSQDGRLLPENMRKVNVSEDEIRQAVRRAGVHRLSQVRCVILERNGAVSVIRAEDPVDPWLLEDVSGGNRHS
jgi:uncharacterized membrane protein YcaP (DUF421 family)